MTGASSGIGAATARALAQDGFFVVCAARREDKISALADEIGGQAIRCDITDQAAVDALAKQVGDRVDVLVNNAGGAFGQEPVAEADLDAWQRMFELNVIATTRVVKALLPAVTAAHGSVITVTSTAAEVSYEGGAGYCGAKHAERAMVEALRLELCGEPVRVCEVCPGMVHTDEFSLNRFEGNQDKADSVYEGVPNPLVAEDIGECIRWIASLPWHVNIDRLVVRPVAQAAQHKVFRGSYD